MDILRYKLADAPLQKINDPAIAGSGVNLFIKREDLIHPAMSGNKWHKLKYNLAYARDNDYSTLLTFGGAYSNHIYAAAAAGKIFNFKTIGIIRGEEHLPLNPTLQFAVDNEMHLHYMQRSRYRKKRDEEILNELKSAYGNFYHIPEGGTNLLALKGCSMISSSIDIPVDYICTPSGTGGTIAGIISFLSKDIKAIGFAVLKGGKFLEEEVAGLLIESGNNVCAEWMINTDYHFGGYAKFNNQLIDFIKRFETVNGIPLDPVYTGKMMFGIYDLIEKGFFKKGETVAAIHTGGLQGLAGFRQRFKLL